MDGRGPADARPLPTSIFGYFDLGTGMYQRKNATERTGMINTLCQSPICRTRRVRQCSRIKGPLGIILGLDGKVVLRLLGELAGNIQV